MDEPLDLEEHEEPNPIQDDVESDKALMGGLVQTGWRIESIGTSETNHCSVKFAKAVVRMVPCTSFAQKSAVFF